MDAFTTLFLHGLRYEQWLRFFFMEDDGEDGARISVSGEAVQRSLSEEPEMKPMLDMLNGREVSLENSRNALFAWLKMQTAASGDGFDVNMGKISADAVCKRQMDLFSGWVQALADGDAALPCGENIPSFSEWNSAFAAWLERAVPEGH